MSRCPDCRSNANPCDCGRCEECEEKDYRISQLEEDLKSVVKLLKYIESHSIDHLLKIRQFKKDMESA